MTVFNGLTIWICMTFRSETAEAIYSKFILQKPTKLVSYAMSFYRSQNVLCRSNFFVSHKKFIYILCQSQKFCATQKNYLHSVKLFFCWHKRFWRGTKCSQMFELTQKIWTGTKHFGTCKRTRHKINRNWSWVGKKCVRLQRVGGFQKS